MDETNPGKYLLDNYLDVFVNEALASLPPHCAGFDCKVKLKPGSVPPFG